MAKDLILVNISGVCCYLDYILVTGGTDATHLEALSVMLKRLLDANIKLKKEKCIFGVSSLTYLGHRIDAKGLHPLQNKLKAIVDIHVPKCLQELY